MKTVQLPVQSCVKTLLCFFKHLPELQYLLNTNAVENRFCCWIVILVSCISAQIELWQHDWAMREPQGVQAIVNRIGEPYSEQERRIHKMAQSLDWLNTSVRTLSQAVARINTTPPSLAPVTPSQPAPHSLKPLSRCTLPITSAVWRKYSWILNPMHYIFSTAP